MADISEVRYARSADGIDIAYQTVGHGPIDLVFVSGFTSHLDLNWDFPWYNWPPEFDGFARVILFDKRGSGRRRLRLPGADRVHQRQLRVAW